MIERAIQALDTLDGDPDRELEEDRNEYETPPPGGASCDPLMAFCPPRLLCGGGR